MKDYAKEKGVSYEAIRKQVNRYKDELEGHITKIDRTQYLDDEAVAFLDDKRAVNPVILMEVGKDEEIERLNNENKALLLELASVNKKLNEVRDALDDSREKIHQLEVEKVQLIEASHSEDLHEQAVTLDEKEDIRDKGFFAKLAWLFGSKK